MKILVPVDGSQHSEAALASVIHHPWQEELDIKLLNVLKPLDSFIPFSRPTRHKNATDPALEETRTLLKQIAENLKKKLPGARIEHDVVSGKVKDTIVQQASRYNADLIVLGSHGKKGSKTLLGGVSQTILEQANRPVLIVKLVSAQSHLHAEQGFQRVLVALDGSPCSSGAMTWLSNRLWSEQTVFKIISAIPKTRESFSAEKSTQKAAWLLREWNIARDRALSMLEQEALKLGKGTNNETVSVDVVPGDPRERIIGTARGWKADLIILGSHGRSPLNRLIVGSVSQNVAVKAPCSVLIVKGVSETPTRDRKSDKATFKKKNPWSDDDSKIETTHTLTDLENWSGQGFD